MASLFSRKRNEEKYSADSPTPVQDVDPARYSSEEGVVDEAADDLHRGMKPRQLSMSFSLSPRFPSDSLEIL